MEGSISVSLYPGVQINGTIGASYQVQYRTNLAGGDWMPLTNIVLPGSPYLFFDPDPITNNSGKYYRVSSSAEHPSVDIGTPAANAWTVSAAGISNVPPYVDYGNPSGLEVTSTGDGNGFFLLGTSLAAFDGFWTASTTFYLPPGAANVILAYSDLGYDDAGVLFLNGTAIAATAEGIPSTNASPGQFVFMDGAASQPSSFSGPDTLVSGVVTNGFIFGGANTFSSTINNTGSGPSGNLQDISGGDFTSFTVAATVAYDLNPVAGSLAIGLDPGLLISGTIGGIYQLQYTADAASGNWTALTNIVLPSSPYLFFDTDAITNQISRSYRVVAR